MEEKKLNEENKNLNEKTENENVETQEKIKNENIVDETDIHKSEESVHPKYEDYKPKKRKKENGIFKIIVILFIILCVVCAFYFPLLSKNNKTTSIKTTTVQEPATIDSGTQTILTDVSSVIEEIEPALVSVTTVTEYVNPYAQFFGLQDSDATYTSEGAGSGVIIGKTDKELLIVTNNHVIDGSKNIKITFVDNKSVNADLKSTDTNNDIALLSVNVDNLEDETLNKVKIITMGDSENLKLGEGVIAAGNALGYGLTITTGVVSATDREIEDTTSGTKTYIQTDAAINPGNSGGALVNAKGELIGINVAKLADTEIEGIGFAIPISSIKESIESMSKEETRTKVDENEKGYLGIKVSDIDNEIVESYGVPAGAKVEELTTTNAKESGLKVNDIITEINGKTVTNSQMLSNELNYYKSGTTVTLKVQRLENKTYKEETIKIKLSKSSSDSQVQNTEDTNEYYIFH